MTGLWKPLDVKKEWEEEEEKGSQVQGLQRLHHTVLKYTTLMDANEMQRSIWPRRNGPDVWRMWTRHSWASLSSATPENAHLGHQDTTRTGKWSAQGSRILSRGPGETLGPSVGWHLSKGGANYLVRSHFNFTQPITEGRSPVVHLLMYISTNKRPRLMGETLVLIHFPVAKHGTANIACLV